MKILIITNLYPPYERGGAELVVRKEARDLRDAGHNVFVLTSMPFSGFKSLTPAAKVEDGITVLRYFPLNLFWYRHDWKFPKFLRLFWHILDTFNICSFFVTKSVLKRVQPDQIRSHNLKGIGLTTALALRQEANGKWTHFLHDVQLFEPSGLLYNRKTFGSTFYAMLTRWLFGSPDIIEAPSQWIINEHIKVGFFNISRKRTVKWYPDPKPLLMDANRHNPRFMFVGQLAEHKGILFLADVLAGMTPGFTLDVVGGGPMDREIKERFSGNPWVHFHGRVTQQEVLSLLKGADYLLVPSLAAENCPTVIVDALKCDVPVIASRVGGIPEMLQHGVNGFLVDANDKKQWLQTLQHLLTRE